MVYVCARVRACVGACAIFTVKGSAFSYTKNRLLLVRDGKESASTKTISFLFTRSTNDYLYRGIFLAITSFSIFIDEFFHRSTI